MGRDQVATVAFACSDALQLIHCFRLPAAGSACGRASLLAIVPWETERAAMGFLAPRFLFLLCYMVRCSLSPDLVARQTSKPS